MVIIMFFLINKIILIDLSTEMDQTSLPDNLCSRKDFFLGSLINVFNFFSTLVLYLGFLRKNFLRDFLNFSEYSTWYTITTEI